MSNCCASSASVLSPFTAARATFALKAGVWFRRGRLVIVSPFPQPSWLLSGRNSTHRPCPDSPSQLFVRQETRGHADEQQGGRRRDEGEGEQRPARTRDHPPDAGAVAPVHPVEAAVEPAERSLSRVLRGVVDGLQ